MAQIAINSIKNLIEEIPKERISSLFFRQTFFTLENHLLYASGIIYLSVESWEYEEEKI